jgi:uncharacterized protein (DUF1330 family)
LLKVAFEGSGVASDAGSILTGSFFEAAKAWYESPAYQAIRPHRFKGAIYGGLVVEGV